MSEPTDEAATETAPASPESATAEPVERSAQPKQHLGRYEIDSVLGVGGMGVVYAAFDPELERRVALKVLPDTRRGQSARERLLREARAMARLTDPNVVRVYEVDSVGGHDFVAMELVDGSTLTDWLKKTAHTPEEVVDRFVAAGRGLVAAHDAGVVHRDFKPHNVLCAKDGRILVTDFGLARGVETNSGDDPSEPPSRATPLSGITETGSVMGTPAYMAPEQRAGEVVGPAADQFSFCVALWEALAGTRPYRGNAEEMLAAIARGPWALDASMLPRRLRAALRRGLEPDPAKRWPSMQALLVQIAPPARRWLVPTGIAGAAIATTAAIAVVLATRGDASGCGASVLDPDVVWPAGASAALIAKDQRGVARLLDRDLATWKRERATACKADPKQRPARLACLDGVLTRMDLVVRAARGASSVKIEPEDLIEPTVCERSTPRLPRAFAPELLDVLTASMKEQEHQGTFPPEVLADLDKRAKQDPCARAHAAWTRAQVTSNAGSQLKAARDAELQADRCGDDHLLAALDTWSAIAQLQLDPQASGEYINRAETAIARVPTNDLLAKLEIIHLFEARRDKKIDDALARGTTAIAKLDARGCISCSTNVAVIVLDLLRVRATPADLDAVRSLLATQRAKIVDALGVDSAEFRVIEGARANWLWSQGQLEEAHRIFDAIRKPRPIPKPHGLKVLVVDGEGHPVPGVLVIAGSGLIGDSLRAAFVFGPDAYQRTGTTNERGELELPAVEEDAIAIAELGDRRSAPQAGTGEVKLVLEPTSRLSGKVALDGVDPTTATVGVLDETSLGVMGMNYWVTAPVHRDGSFEVAGVLRRRMQVFVKVADLSQWRSSAFLPVNVDRAAIAGLALSVPSTQRSVHVLVRSTVNMEVPTAAIALYSGRVSSSNVAEIAKRTDVLASTVPERIDLTKVPPEVKALARKDDLHGTLEHVPQDAVSVCATGFPRADQADAELGKKFQAHPEKVEVRCVELAPNVNVVVVEVPPFPRFD